MDDVEFKSNVKEVLSAEEKAVKKALTMIGLLVERDAIAKTPVDTGLLRNSITHAISGESPAKSSYKANKAKKGSDKIERGSYSGTIGSTKDKAVYIGTNVEYAPYIEYGHRYGTSSESYEARHMLQDAVNANKGNIKKVIEQELGK